VIKILRDYAPVREGLPLANDWSTGTEENQDSFALRI